MKTLTLISTLVVLLLPIRVKAETVAWGTNEVVSWQVTVPTNHAMLIHAASDTWRRATPETIAFWRITQGTEVYEDHRYNLHELFWHLQLADKPVERANEPAVLAGPMMIELQVGKFLEPVFMSYTIAPCEGLQTLVWDSTNGSNILSITDGQRLKVVSEYANYCSLDVADVTVDGVSWAERGAIDGPATLTFGRPEEYSDDVYHVTYTLEETSSAQITSGVISLGGYGVVTVEKSSDMTNWNPAAIMLNDGTPKSFYRLKAGN